MVQVVDVENGPMLASTNNRPKYAEVKDTPEAMGGSDDEGRKGEGVKENRAKSKSSHAGRSTNHADTM